MFEGMDNHVLLQSSNLHKAYADIEVLKGIDLTVKKGELVSIVGASGAGKSTLLHILGSLDKPDRGSVEIDGIKLNHLKGNQLSRYRNQHIGFVFQFHNLLPEFTALENVCLPAFIGNKTLASTESKAKELMDLLGLSERLHHKPSQLSGGEQQRTAVARALINSPEIVFADEPTGNLDSTNAKQLQNLLLELRARLNLTFVIVTHNNALANFADRKLTIRDGQLN